MDKKLVVAGRIVTTIPVLFLLFDVTIKLMNIAAVRESFARLGYASTIGVTVGVVELFCLVVYLVPRTSAAGAVLLTGFLGGAVATHLRMGDPLWTHVLFPTYVGALLWSGLLLRNQRLRSLVRL